MSQAVVLPELDTQGEPIRISCWLVEAGEAVETGDRLVEVLLRGVTFDVSAPVSGVLAAIDKPFDTQVVPGDILGWIETSRKDADSSPEAQ